MITEIRTNADHTFEHIHYDQGLSVTPLNASAIIYDNSGTEIDSITGTISGDLMSFVFSQSLNVLIGKNFKIVMTFDISGDILERVYLFDVVNYPIENNIIDENLFSYIKELRNVKQSRKTTTSEGTATTLIDTSLSVDTRNWKGSRGQFLFDDSIVEFKITNYVLSSSIMTFEPAYISNIPADTNYILRESYTEQIEEAFNYVLNRIRQKVGIAANYIDDNSFSEMTIYRTLYMICLNSIEIDGDKWSIRKTEYSSLFDSSMTLFNQAYDRDQDGNISTGEDNNRPSFSSISFRR